MRVPDTIGELDRRTTKRAATAAWGEPTAVIYRCGLPDLGPSDLPCFDVDGVDWLLDESNAPRYVFTTYGRTPATEVIVDIGTTSRGPTPCAPSARPSRLSRPRRAASPRPDVFGGGSVAPSDGSDEGE